MFEVFWLLVRLGLSIPLIVLGGLYCPILYLCGCEKPWSKCCDYWEGMVFNDGLIDEIEN